MAGRKKSGGGNNPSRDQGNANPGNTVGGQTGTRTENQSMSGRGNERGRDATPTGRRQKDDPSMAPESGDRKATGND